MRDRNVYHIPECWYKVLFGYLSLQYENILLYTPFTRYLCFNRRPLKGNQRMVSEGIYLLNF